MKTIKTILLALVTLVCYSNVNNASAQVNLGVGVSYGSEAEEAGLNIRGGYLAGERLNLRADANFFGNRTAGTATTRWRDVNLNGTYWLRTGERFIFYPLAGLNITTVRTETTVTEPDGAAFTRTGTDTEMGLNLGGGVAYQLNGITPFAEGKYVTGDFAQGVFTFGLYYLFNQ